jgi:hypothetical protein
LGVILDSKLNWKKAQQASVIREIGHLQRLACICFTLSMRSTPSAGLETLLMLPHLIIHSEVPNQGVLDGPNGNCHDE